VAEAIYGKVPGAALTNISGIGEVWGLPCNQELNATFLFAGIKFPIHPLDLNFEYAVDNCIGAVSLAIRVLLTVITPLTVPTVLVR
jgi:hypothetical protein